jgi:hypothetical protein
MKQLIVILAICALGYVFDHWQALAERHGGVSTNSHELIVYGIKSSSASVQLEYELKKLGIPFENRDLSIPSASRELTEKMVRVGKAGRAPSLPAAEIDGVLVEGVSIEEIARRLR